MPSNRRPRRAFRNRPQSSAAANHIRSSIGSMKRRSVALCRARLAQILDLLAEDSWPNVYAGELDVRPPGAPTTRPDTEERVRLGNLRLVVI